MEIILTRLLAAAAILGVAQGVYIEVNAENIMHQIGSAIYFVGGCLLGALVLAISRLHRIQLAVEKAAQRPASEAADAPSPKADSKADAWAALKG